MARGSCSSCSSDPVTQLRARVASAARHHASRLELSSAPMLALPGGCNNSMMSCGASCSGSGGGAAGSLASAGGARATSSFFTLRSPGAACFSSSAKTSRGSTAMLVTAPPRLSSMARASHRRASPLRRVGGGGVSSRRTVAKCNRCSSTYRGCWATSSGLCCARLSLVRASRAERSSARHHCPSCS
eukprot:scaffold3380_cov44-Phaeocystis_antarctica.AAC.3